MALRNMFRRTMATSARTVKYNAHGAPASVLSVESQEVTSSLQNNEVLLKMIEFPITSGDLRKIEGYAGGKPGVAGSEGVAQVVKTGSGVKNLSVGNTVVSSVPFGTWGEMVVTNADHVNKVEDPSTALALGPTSCTALRILSDFGSLKEGDWIVQNAANGAVGQAVIQIAKARGLKTINVVRGAAENGAIDSLKSLGGDIVVPESYFMSTEYKRLVEKLPAPKLGINGVGGDSVTNVARSLGQGAHLVTYGSVSRNAVTIPTSALVNKNLSLSGFSYATWASETSSAQREGMIKELSDLVQSKKLTMEASDKFKFDDFQKALDKALEGHYSNASSDYYEEKVVVTL